MSTVNDTVKEVNEFQATTLENNEETESKTIAISVPIGSKRKIPSFKEIVLKADEKIKRKLIPIQAWDALTLNKVYAVRSLHEIEVTLKSKEKKWAKYICVEDDKSVMMNIWISDMVTDELEKHSISNENICIIALGKRRSKLTSYDYNDFIVIKASD